MTDDQQRTTTRLSKKWKRRMALFFLLFFALGTWGLIDAGYIYPKRGRKAADFLLYQHMTNLGSLVSRASVADPATRLRELEESDELTGHDLDEYNWLTALSRVANLDAIERRNAAEPDRDYEKPGFPAAEKRTVFLNSNAVYSALDERFAGADVPDPLSAYDLPIQWLIMLAGMLGAAAVAVHFLRAGMKSYRYEPETMRLHFPGGRSATPDELEYIDKRKWDKWFVFVKIEGQPDEIKLDLLKYEPLEDWILGMEKEMPGYEPDPEDKAEAEAPEDDDPDRTAEVK